MRDGFSAIFSVVDHETKALVGRGDSETFRDLPGGEEEMPQEILIIAGGFPDPGNQLFRNHQDVDRSLRADIVKGDALVVLVNDISLDLAGDNFFKNGHSDPTGEVDLLGDRHVEDRVGQFSLNPEFIDP